MGVTLFIDQHSLFPYDLPNVVLGILQGEVGENTVSWRSEGLEEVLEVGPEVLPFQYNLEVLLEDLLHFPGVFFT